MFTTASSMRRTDSPSRLSRSGRLFWRPTRPPEDPDDFPSGTRIGFQPATDSASGEASEVEAASDKAVGQKDGDNEVTVNNGKVDSVRTAPDATRGDG